MTLNFEALGYESSLFLLNMGSMIFVYMLFPIIVALLFFMQIFGKTCKRKARKALNRMFFDSILRFFEETYLITTLCCFINLKYAYNTKQYLDLNSILSYTALIIVVFYPLGILYLLIRLKEIQLDRANVKKRVGVIYEELNLSNGKTALIWPLFLNLEKLILAFVLVFVQDYPFFQLLAVDYLATAYIIILGMVEPYKY